MSEEKERGVIFTPKVEEEGRIDEFPLIKEVDIEDKIIEVTPSVQSVIPLEELEKIKEEIKAEVEAEVENEGAIGGAVEGVADDDSKEDLNKKTYTKITSTFYVKPAGTEKNDKGEDVKLYKVLNPETNVVEKRQLTETEKHEILVHEIKESHIKFRPVKTLVKREVVGTTTVKYGTREKKREIKSDVVHTNITTNQFDKDYRKKRQRKNRMARASRKANR